MVYILQTCAAHTQHAPRFVGTIRLPFQELLRSSLYSAAVEASLPRVVVRAASVLGAVKERAMKAGEIMDAATEEILKPQVRLTF